MEHPGQFWIGTYPFRWSVFGWRQHAGQMGHSVEMFQKTYTKWIDGDQNELEIAKLEANLKNQISPGLVPETSKTA